jgi:hypothetical protein
MRLLLWACLLYGHVQAKQPVNINKIRDLYCSAPLVKQDAKQLDQLMVGVNVDTNAPVLVCYKGASQMIDAKYSLNPYLKFENFNKGKELMTKAISRDTLNLEMRFIRYSIQSNLPGFLGYHDELSSDKNFLLVNTRLASDPQLKEIIFTFFCGQSMIKPEELKQLKN